MRGAAGAEESTTRRRSCIAATALAALVLGLLWPPSGSALERSATDPALVPAPDWVVPVAALDARTDVDAIRGRRHLLVDRQYHDDGVVVGDHRHYVTEIVNQVGLSAGSKLSIEFDPAYQHLELHSALVHRDGRASDRLAGARVSVARTEDSSRRDLLHGELTALVILQDVRVGDRVEVGYTVFGRNPVFGPRQHGRWRVRWGVPVARSVLRVTLPDDSTLSHTPMPDAERSESVAGGLRTLNWQWDGLDASKAEGDTPADHPDPDMLELTTYRNWQEVADWGATLFAGHAARGEEYRALVRSIRTVAERDGMESAVAMAIDHVQRRIRYYGIELGENSHRPHAPDEVLANGYGDCKDKALLLVTLLGELDVDAWPMLVSARMRGGIVDRLPSPSVFDHAVVLIEHAGRQFWVDATDNRQSGLLGLRGQPEYGAGLVLGKAGEALITRAPPLPELPTQATHDKIYLSSFGGPVDFITSTLYRGREANRFRRELEERGERGLRKRYLDFYREMYGELESLGPLQLDRDESSNTIRVTESYRLNAFWNIDERDGDAAFDVHAVTVRGRVAELPGIDAGRRAPLSIDGPIKVAHRIEFFPDVSSGERTLEERSFGFDGFRYRDSEYLTGGSLVFDSELAITSDRLAIAQVGDYRKFRQRLLRNAQSGRYYRDFDRDELGVGRSTTTLLGELQALHR